MHTADAVKTPLSSLYMPGYIVMGVSADMFVSCISKMYSKVLLYSLKWHIIVFARYWLQHKLTQEPNRGYLVVLGLEHIPILTATKSCNY